MIIADGRGTTTTTSHDVHDNDRVGVGDVACTG